MYNIVFCFLYTLQHDYHQKFSFHPSLYGWPPFTHFVLFPHPSPSGNHSSVLYVFAFALFCFVFLFFNHLHMSEIIWNLSFSVRLISLDIIPSSSIHVVTNGKISSFLWLVFHMILHFHFLVFTWRIWNTDSKRYLQLRVYHSIICSNQDMETTWVSTDGWMNKGDVVCNAKFL